LIASPVSVMSCCIASSTSHCVNVSFPANARSTRRRQRIAANHSAFPCNVP
jgi:hypothetical protein